ncbi:hypothetical protein [Micromonospora sp. DPT]|uniref:hypothetical protein n=1 Tax=Micromonospora sp. DPT TaxID=3142975 RepID=UPI0032098854
MKLAGWARRNGAQSQTAYRWFREGMMPVPARRLPFGTVRVDVAGDDNQGQVIVYARVSSADQRADGCALNGRRERLFGLLRDPNVSAIVVEHRDRFARFGVEYVEAALTAQRRRLLVVGPAGDLA